MAKKVFVQRQNAAFATFEEAEEKAKTSRYGLKKEIK